VSFTGSDAVGRKVYGQGADTMKKVVLELGGKSANVILDNASLDKVVNDVIGGMTIHCGQGCSLLTRTIVHESLHDELVGRVKVALDYVKVGDPADPAVFTAQLATLVVDLAGGAQAVPSGMLGPADQALKLMGRPR
jgi:aldehyde dehydrogenase (NAD+)